MVIKEWTIVTLSFQIPAVVNNKNLQNKLLFVCVCAMQTCSVMSMCFRLCMDGLVGQAVAPLNSEIGTIEHVEGEKFSHPNPPELRTFASKRSANASFEYEALRK